MKIYLGFLMFLHVFILGFLSFTAWPEMFSFPYLISQGYSLYEGMVYVYTPILPYLLLGVFRIFGYKILTLKAFTWILILLNDFLIYKIAHRLTKKEYLGVLATGIYVFLQPFWEGNMLWFDLAYVTPVLLSFYFLIRKKYFSAGLAVSIAFLTKQIAVVFVTLFLVQIFLSRKRIDESVYRYVIGVLVPVGIFVFYLISSGNLEWFFNWTFYYPMKYWGLFPGYVDLNLSKLDFFEILCLLLPFLIGLYKIRGEPVAGFLAAVLLASFLAFYPRFSFFHLQMFVAFFAVYSAYVVNYAGRRYVFLLLIFLTLSVAGHFRGGKASFGKDRFWEKETLLFAEMLPQKSHLYYLNLPSHYYFLTKSLPPKPWVDNFGWYWEVPGFQQKTLDCWSVNPPKYIVWQKGAYEPKTVTSWIKANYNSDKLVENITIWQKKEN